MAITYRKEFVMFKKVFGLFGFGCDEVKVQVEALLQEVALLKEDLNNLSTKVVDHVEESVDYGSIADNISYSQLAHAIDIFDLVKKIHVDYEDLASSIDMSELANHMDIVEVADNISLNDLAKNISVGDIVDSIQEDIADKVFEKFLEKIKSID